MTLETDPIMTTIQEKALKVFFVHFLKILILKSMENHGFVYAHNLLDKMLKPKLTSYLLILFEIRRLLCKLCVYVCFYVEIE